MRLALCQLNATVGDIGANAELIRSGVEAARDVDADLVLFGELALTGYPPEDLLLREHFLSDARSALEGLAAETHGVVAVVIPGARRGRLQRGGGTRRRSRSCDLSQGPSAQLRSVRRAPLLSARAGGGGAAARRTPRRSDDLR